MHLEYYNGLYFAQACELCPKFHEEIIYDPESDGSTACAWALRAWSKRVLKYGDRIHSPSDANPSYDQ